MTTKICPYCKETIYSNALVCRYCKRDLPEYADERVKVQTSSNWIPALLTSAFIVTGTALVVYEFLKERRNWQDKE